MNALPQWPPRRVLVAARQNKALRLLKREPNQQASSARMGRLLGFAKGGHGPASAIMCALERRGLVFRTNSGRDRWAHYVWCVKKVQ